MPIRPPFSCPEPLRLRGRSRRPRRPGRAGPRRSTKATRLAGPRGSDRRRGVARWSGRSRRWRRVAPMRSAWSFREGREPGPGRERRRGSVRSLAGPSVRRFLPRIPGAAILAGLAASVLPALRAQEAARETPRHRRHPAAGRQAGPEWRATSGSVGGTGTSSALMVPGASGSVSSSPPSGPAVGSFSSGAAGSPPSSGMSPDGSSSGAPPTGSTSNGRAVSDRQVHPGRFRLARQPAERGSRRSGCSAAGTPSCSGTETPSCWLSGSEATDVAGRAGRQREHAGGEQSRERDVRRPGSGERTPKSRSCRQIGQSG